MGIHQQPNAVRETETRDLFPPSVLRDLALVVEQTVNRAGGTEAVAALLGTNKGRVSEWSNPDHPAWPNLRQIANIERFAKVDWITRALADLHEADVIKRRSAFGAGAVLEQLSAASREIGEAIAASAGAAGAPTCPKACAAAVREANDAIRAMQQLIAAVQAQIGEGV
jgi:hypothetical protein